MPHINSIMSANIPQIDDRLREIGAEIARLQKEAEELAIAKRVFERFSDPPPNGASPKAGSPEGRPRPKGSPTNFEMAEFVLADAEKEGKDGLTAGELVQAIAARYWPGLVGPQILPSIYKFAKDERLRKTPGGKFKRAKKAAVNATEVGSGQNHTPRE
jgi:hypothetical protein